MGHRKYHAPRRGSLAFLPRGRAKRWLPRVTYWPSYEGKPVPLAFCGYKAGMTYGVVIDNRQGAVTFGKELVVPFTVIETPPLLVSAVRAYKQTERVLKSVGEAWMDAPPKDFERLFSVPESFKTEEKLSNIESELGEMKEIRVLLATQPREVKHRRNKPELFEARLAGSSVKEQFAWAKANLGKEVKVTDILKEGQFVDVVGITKGKGIQGPVKRWGIRRKFHKSRKTVRQVGSIGPWHPHFVVYSVPRAGQMGFHQRTEYNKQVMKIGNDGAEVTPKGGFIRYGVVVKDYVLIKGTVPGPAGHPLILRYAARKPELTPPPKIEYLSVESKLGD